MRETFAKILKQSCMVDRLLVMRFWMKQSVISGRFCIHLSWPKAPNFYLFSVLLSNTLLLRKLRHAFPNFCLLDCIALPMQRHASGLTISNYSPTRCGHRLPKRDARTQRFMLGPHPSSRWYGVLAKHVEYYNNHLQGGRAMGKLFHA